MKTNSTVKEIKKMGFEMKLGYKGDTYQCRIQHTKFPEIIFQCESKDRFDCIDECFVLADAWLGYSKAYLMV